MSDIRGSERLMAAFRSRLTEDSVGMIAGMLDQSSGIVDSIDLHGGAEPTGVSITSTYTLDGDFTCGNDLSFWLSWLRKHGGGGWVPPKIIINGTPWPEFLTMKLVFGRIDEHTVSPVDVHQVLAGR